MKRTLLFLVAAITLFFAYSIYQFRSGAKAMQEAKGIVIPKVEEVASIDDIVKNYINHDLTKGLSIGVYDSGQVTYHNYGIRSDDHPVPPTHQSVYEIASITKTFTAAILAQMVSEGKVSYDDPVSMYLPEKVVHWSDSLSMTLEELATHKSGLPSLPYNHILKAFYHMDNPYNNYTEDDLYSFFTYFEPVAKQNRKVEYSNLGAGLLGNILAQVAGVSYSELVDRYMLNPLGMNDSYVGYREGHQMTGYNGYGAVTPAWESQTLQGAGSIRATTEDLMKYLTANVNAEQPYAETHQSRADFDGFGAGTKIGLAWLTIYPKDSDLELVFHNGGSGGFKSALFFSKKTDQGVVVLANSIQSVDAIGLRIMEYLDNQSEIVQAH